MRMITYFEPEVEEIEDLEETKEPEMEQDVFYDGDSFDQLDLDLEQMEEDSY